jgi:molybdopterin synthase catalytic subunit
MAQRPSIDAWLTEAKQDPGAPACGMCLTHVGTVRESPKQLVRQGVDDGTRVTGMVFGYDAEKVAQAVEACRAREGIGYVRVWLNEGELEVGDDIMQVLIGGDIRPRVIDALQALVGTIKNECVSEVERREA